MTDLDRIIQKKILQGTLAQCLMVSIAAMFSTYAHTQSFRFAIFAGTILLVSFIRIAVNFFTFPFFESRARQLKILNYGFTLTSGLCWGILAALDLNTCTASSTASNFLMPMIAVGNVAAAITTLFYDLWLTRLYVCVTLFPHFIWLVISFLSGKSIRSFSEGYSIATVVLLLYVWRESGFANALYWQNVEMHRQSLIKQKELENSRAMALASAKMAAVGEMAGGIAHELNGPLTNLQGLLNRMLDKSQAGTLATENLHDKLTRTRKSVDRMSRITRGLLSFARQTHQDEITIRSIHELVSEIKDLSQERLQQQNIELRLNIPATDIHCCDRGTQISQTLMNLLNNSIDALSSRTEEPAWIEIAVQHLENFVYISVTDSGPGIPESHEPHIFQAFFTTKQNQDGTGLGLSISRALIENLGGELYYDNSATNTRFTIKIPVKVPTPV